jgi:hypothetical protein
MIMLGNRYTIKEDGVYWGTYAVPRADPATFQHLGGDWGRDANNIFVQFKTKKIDVATFNYLNSVYVKDANSVYDWEGVLKGADAESFETLDPGVIIPFDIATEARARGYARDRNSVYYHDQAFGRATALRGADPKSFVSLRNDYGFDSKSVWYQKARLPKSDPKTWIYIGQQWSMDRDRIYYVDREVAGVNRNSFTVVPAPTIGNYATDGDQFFSADQLIVEDEFWSKITKDFAAFESWFRSAFHRIRKTCTYCNGSGDCYCKRKGEIDTVSCARCSGSGKCHVCRGKGRT